MMMMSLQSNHNLPYSVYHQLSVRENPATMNLRLRSSGGYPHLRLTATPPKTLFNVESTHSTSIKFPRVMMTSKRPLLLLAATNSDESHPSDEPSSDEAPAATYKWLNLAWDKFIKPFGILTFGYVSSLAWELYVSTFMKDILEMFPEFSLFDGCLSKEKRVGFWMGPFLKKFSKIFPIGISIFGMVAISNNMSQPDTQTEKNTKPGSAPSKPGKLSPEMEAFVSEIPLKELTKMVKMVFSHIKEHGLRDRNDKNVVICDAKLKKIFEGQDRVELSEIHGLLRRHYLNPEN